MPEEQCPDRQIKSKLNLRMATCHTESPHCRTTWHWCRSSRSGPGCYQLPCIVDPLKSPVESWVIPSVCGLITRGTGGREFSLKTHSSVSGHLPTGVQGLIDLCNAVISRGIVSGRLKWRICLLKQYLVHHPYINTPWHQQLILPCQSLLFLHFCIYLFVHIHPR